MLDGDAVLAFARDHYADASVGKVTLKPLSGGLESAGIARAFAEAPNGRQVGSFVVKKLDGPALREHIVHRAVQESNCAVVAPRLYGFRENGPNQGYQFLEWVEPSRRWPWKEPKIAALVLERLARVHTCDAASRSGAFESWDYDSDLAKSALTTVEIYRSTFTQGVRVTPRPMLQTLGRVAHALPKIRAQLAEYMGRRVLHGDAHPGNAIIRNERGVERALLLDWGRARLGSPLEDVCSWVQSLAFWEPEARRRHDTLLVRYLEFRGFTPKLSSGFREAYWLAAGCNAFAGALRYHLALAADPARTDRVRGNSARAAADWLRVVRRADACWRK